METCGVIDIGANTIRLNIYKIEGTELNQIFSKKSVAGINSYIEKGVLSERGMNKLEMVLGNLMKIYELLKTEKMYAFATASLRNISNLDEVLSRIKDKLNINIEMIPQEDEARLGYLGISQNNNKDNGITVDIGGGSIEIVKFENHLPNGFINLDEGSLSLFNKYVSDLLPTNDEIKKISTIMKDKLNTIYKGNFEAEEIFGIGGTIRACGNIINEMGLSENTKVFTYDQFKEFYHGLKKQDKKVITIVLQVVPERIHTITSGAIALKIIMDKFNTKKVLVSSFGLREGFLLEKIRR